MDITVQLIDPASLIVVKLSGSLDVSGAAKIDIDVKAAANRGLDVAVDLSDVTFLSSQGTRILVIASKIAATKQNTLSLISPRPPVLKALSIMGVDKIIPIYGSLEELTTHRGQ